MRDIRAAVAVAGNSGFEAARALLEDCGAKVVGHAGDGAQAVELCRWLRPDVLLMDLVLPGTDGLLLARRLWKEPLAVYPGVILQHYGALPEGEAERFAQMGGEALRKPVSREALAEAIVRTLPENRRVPEEAAERLRDKLDALGVPAHPGREFLEAAILLAWMDRRLTGKLMRELYPMVGERFGATVRRVEQAMRHAIDAAWRSGAMDAQDALFQGTIDAQRGKPTCGEMIARLADILRWEE